MLMRSLKEFCVPCRDIKTSLILGKTTKRQALLLLQDIYDTWKKADKHNENYPAFSIYRKEGNDGKYADCKKGTIIESNGVKMPIEKCYEIYIKSIDDYYNEIKTAIEAILETAVDTTGGGKIDLSWIEDDKDRETIAKLIDPDQGFIKPGAINKKFPVKRGCTKKIV
ncbi:hypothetical protein FACS1894137_10770 [Spirochaetia bacterium]|nr:hypothetical protein FACS1894137_10770 [Spirochaetia bacterium]